MTIVLLAHGSPDPRHARDVRALSDRVVDRLSALSDRVGERFAALPDRGGEPRAIPAYLDHNPPDPVEAAQALQRAGADTATVVPLLIGPAYHVRVDVPEAIGTMRRAAPGLRVVGAEAVGLHPMILGAAAELVEHAGLDLGPRWGVVLAATGSRESAAVAAFDSLVADSAASLAARLGIGHVRAGFLDGGRSVAAAAADLGDLGCAEIAMVSVVIAEGVLRDRLVAAAQAAGLQVVPGALAATDALADLVVLRARESLADPRPRAGQVVVINPADESAEPDRPPNG